MNGPSKLLIFNDRQSDSPLVERVWRSHSEGAGTFLSVASSHWEMVVTRHRGQLTMTLKGPETKAAPVVCPADAEWLGIRFRLGTFMPLHPVDTLIDHRDVILPQASDRTFWLEGSRWEYPGFENVEEFVARLWRHGLITADAAVQAAIAGERSPLSLRSMQRRFLHAAGTSLRTIRQTERARHATLLLDSGVSILHTVARTGYFDQAHLTRSLRHLTGETPRKILQKKVQLSFLYKTPAMS